SILRLDVSGGGAGYAIPLGNPFSSPDRPEIWTFGLRNPWRFSFDRQTGDLYLGDVGQEDHEEIHVSSAADGAGRGLNFGWRIMEGRSCYNASSCNQNGLTLPVLDYPHSGGACSVTGGYVYRGSAIPALRGAYLYGDYCAGWVRSFRYQGGQATQPQSWPSLTSPGLTSFGEDANGELYILTDGGSVFRIESP
ncbi:MAG TPA: PQQ-dependent sugar dehydrogenase, partial [Candidatus Limnocylindria bacterium]|nr:PQQ-dependent sugar dehydrogenase [Candidatus Limnocylindria bacterium]